MIERESVQRDFYDFLMQREVPTHIGIDDIPITAYHRQLNAAKRGPIERFLAALARGEAHAAEDGDDDDAVRLRNEEVWSRFTAYCDDNQIVHGFRNIQALSTKARAPRTPHAPSSACPLERTPPAHAACAQHSAPRHGGVGHGGVGHCTMLACAPSARSPESHSSSVRVSARDGEARGRVEGEEPVARRAAQQERARLGV